MSATPSSAPWWASAVFSPLMTFVFAMLGAWFAIKFDRKKTINQELVKKRLLIYEDMAPKANDLLCYFICVGDWKALDPIKLLEHKRKLDRCVFVYGPLLSPALINKSHQFINSCFSTYQGAGKAAALRANLPFLKSQWRENWNEAWDKCFVESSESIDRKDLRVAYNEFITQFALEIGVNQKAVP
ncbi:MAG TPA: hypothetical protein VEQ16_12325 [Acidocella sp.]|nr:hypothetical protein [Acidocella sp.]